MTGYLRQAAALAAKDYFRQLVNEQYPLEAAVNGAVTHLAQSLGVSEAAARLALTGLGDRLCSV